MEYPSFGKQVRQYVLVRFLQLGAYQLLLFASELPALIWSIGLLVFVAEPYMDYRLLEVFGFVEKRYRETRIAFIAAMVVTKVSAVAFLLGLWNILFWGFVLGLQVMLMAESILFVRIAGALPDQFHWRAPWYFGMLQFAIAVLSTVAIVLGSGEIILWQLLFSWLVGPAILYAWSSILPPEVQ